MLRDDGRRGLAGGPRPRDCPHRPRAKCSRGPSRWHAGDTPLGLPSIPRTSPFARPLHSPRPPPSSPDLHTSTHSPCFSPSTPVIQTQSQPRNSSFNMKLNFLAVLAALPVALAAIAFPVDDPAQGKDFTTERKCASGERRCHRWAVEMCLGGSWKRLQTCPWPMTCEYRTPRRGGAAQPTCIGTLHALGDVDADTDASDHDLLVVAANSPVPDLETRQSFSPPSPCHYGDMACSKDLYSVMVCDKNDKWQVQLKCPKPGCCATYPNGMPYCECGPGMPPPGAEHAAEVEKREDSSDQVCPHSCYMDWWGCKVSLWTYDRLYMAYRSN